MSLSVRRREIVLLRRVYAATGAPTLRYTPFNHRRWIHSGPRTQRPTIYFKDLATQLWTKRFLRQRRSRAFRKQLVRALQR